MRYVNSMDYLCRLYELCQSYKHCYEPVNWPEPIVEGKKQYFRIRKRFYRI